MKLFSIPYHLYGDAQYGLEVELASALLEEVLEGLAQQVHHHHMIRLVILRLLISHEVKVWHTRYTLVRCDGSYSFL